MTDPIGEPTFEVELSGCRPEPLASYLKAIGVFRLVAEQKDREARGFWRGEQFVVRSRLDRDALVRFFVDEWRPTPVVAPWNGGSGFYPKDNSEAADAIVASDEQRLGLFAETINAARAFVTERGWGERPSDDDKKFMLSAMRARLPDEALDWLDAAVVVGGDRLLFPPLLGTGGNDGRLDFSNNFQQRVMAVVTSRLDSTIESALFGTAIATRFKGVMGQYQPAAHSRTNAWDFVLLIEGALVFAAAATRRYESGSPSMMAFPFHARTAGGLSTVTDSDETESRNELWLPLWSVPTSLREIRRLFAEGRATVGSGDHARQASSALDFARAVTALGVDRGLDGFVRIGFHVRNGLAYFATPLGRFATRDVPAARLLDDVDRWFDRFRLKSTGKNAPEGVALARRRLEQTMFEAVERGALGPVLLALGDAELALSRSLTFTQKAFLRPIPTLSLAWGEAVMDGSVEQRLAATLATRPGIRGRLLPLDKLGRAFGRDDDASFVFSDRPLVDNLQALLLREDVEAMQQGRDVAADEPHRALCSLTDIARFIDGVVDDLLIERWLRALVLIGGGLTPDVPVETIWPPASFAVLALVHNRRLGADRLPRTTTALSLACAGNAARATGAAIRRLNASARALPVREFIEPVARMRRIAAALAFSLTWKQRRTLESMVLQRIDAVTTDTATTESLQEPA
jgi:CRISPR-associated protein Csx17